jgi:hypothetical protein
MWQGISGWATRGKHGLLGVPPFAARPSLRDFLAFCREPSEQRVTTCDGDLKVACLERSPDPPSPAVPVQRKMAPPRPVVFPDVVERIGVVDSSRKKSPEHNAFSFIGERIKIRSACADLLQYCFVRQRTSRSSH